MHKARLRAREAYVAQRFEGSFWQVVWSPFVFGSKNIFSGKWTLVRQRPFEGTGSQRLRTGCSIERTDHRTRKWAVGNRACLPGTLALCEKPPTGAQIARCRETLLGRGVPGSPWIYMSEHTTRAEVRIHSIELPRLVRSINSSSY